MGWIEFGVVLIALAFVVLVIFLVRTLVVTQRTVQQLADHMVRIQERIDELSQESVQWIRQTNRLTEEIYHKTKSFDQLFHAVEDVGQAARQLTGSLRQVSASLTNTVNRKIEQDLPAARDQIGEIIKWVAYAYEFWQRWRLSRPQQKKSEGGQQDG